MNSSPGFDGLIARPAKFFMSWKDIPFWIQSARTDTVLNRLQEQHGIQKAFELLYAQKSDPWGATRRCYRYQNQKYDTLLSLLPARPYESTLDLGCGVGEFTRKIAPFSDRVLGLELSDAAVTQAETMSRHLKNVRYLQGDVLQLEALERDSYDLVILADVLYYLSPMSPQVLERVCQKATSLLRPGGILILANHYFFQLDPSSRISSSIHNSFHRAPSLNLIRKSRHPFYLVSILTKTATAKTLIPI